MSKTLSMSCVPRVLYWVCPTVVDDLSMLGSVRCPSAVVIQKHSRSCCSVRVGLREFGVDVCVVGAGGVYRLHAESWGC